MSENKKCTKCLKIKSLILFAKHKNISSGYASRCKACISESNIIYKKRTRMNKTKFDALTGELDLVSQKVLKSIPKQSDWDFNSIAKDVSKATGSRMTTDKLKFCLNGLVNVGLITLKNNRYQQTIIVEKVVSLEVKSSLVNLSQDNNDICIDILLSIDEIEKIRVEKYSSDVDFNKRHNILMAKLTSSIGNLRTQGLIASKTEKELITVKSELEKANLKLKLVKDHHELMKSL